ncbi:MAG: glycogen synthase [Candidatus Euphemobacter frigidus]|nr:glycogen synthase [Candidatus Euphemobacter frigidus]MDP8276590.1 glycogen synthase [Candidatus Euphemobacter frigidus]
MKVTFITKEYPPNVYGGAGVHIRELARCLAEMMEVDVRCFGDQHLDRGNLRVTGYQPEPKLHCPDQPKFDSLFNTIFTDLLILMNRIDADVVHTHTWYAHLAGFLASRLYQVPYVATSHSLEPLRPWKVDQLAEGYYVSAWIEKVGLENADRVVAVSHMMKEDIINNFKVDPDRVVVIHNGIDLKRWNRRPLSPELRDRYGIAEDYILFVGRPTAQKGMEYLIDAADDIPVQVVFEAVGADTKDYEDRMMEKVKGKKNIVWIHENLGDEKNVELYSSARIFVCPSVYEPFGIINLEAMACDTPVVASAVGGIKEVVIPDETGILVDPGSSEQIAAAVDKLLDNPEMAVTMGKNGRRRVEKYFSWERIADQTREMYESLLK